MYVFRQRAGVFGHNAPKWATLPQVVAGQDHLVTGAHLAQSDYANAQYPDDWDDYTVHQSTGTDRVVDLDNVYSQVSPGGWIALESAAGVNAYRVEGANEVTRSAFAMSAKVSHVTVDTNAGLAQHGMRGTTVHAQSERLTLARVPVSEAVSGSAVVLGR